MLSKREWFFQEHSSSNLLCCPYCHGSLVRHDDTLICTTRHVINVNRKGFVNFLSRPVQSEYDHALFESRRHILDSGIYAEVIRRILTICEQENGTVVDCGCGEGWWLSQFLSERPKWSGVGIDISRPAIEQATDYRSHAVFAVADLRRIPVADHATDVVLNILSPASYEEFHRILKPQGKLIKVYPGEHYLQEIRIQRGIPLYNEGDVYTYLNSHMHIQNIDHIATTYSIRHEDWCALIRMTPLNQNLSDEERSLLSNENPGKITIDLYVASCTADI